MMVLKKLESSVVMTFLRKVVITFLGKIAVVVAITKKKQNSGAANRDCSYCIDSIDLMITYSSRLDPFEFFIFYVISNLQSHATPSRPNTYRYM